MTDKKNEGTIPYDAIIQDALRSVIPRVLADHAREGDLPGEHHFYITFRTQDEGVIMPDHLKQRFQEEMTIVIQNRYWELDVKDDLFSIGLSFGGAPCTLVIPYESIVAFQDPSIDFALHFKTVEKPEEEDTKVSKLVDMAQQDNVVSVDFGKK